MGYRESAGRRVRPDRPGGGAWLDPALKTLIVCCAFAVPQVIGWRLGLSGDWPSLVAAGLSAGAATVLGLVFGFPAIAGVGAGHIVAGLLVPTPVTPGLVYEAFSAAFAIAAALALLLRLRRGRLDPLVPDIPAVLIFVAVYCLAETALLLLGRLAGLTSLDIGSLALRLPISAGGALLLILCLNLITSLVLRLVRNS